MRLGEGEVAAVLPHVVVLLGHEGGIIVKVSRPGIAVINIYRVSVAVELPNSGNRHRAPRRVVELYRFESPFFFIDAVEPAEFPYPV